MNKSIIVFSGYNQRAVVAFIRTLSQENIDYGIIASSMNDSIFLSKYKEKVVATRNKKELDIDDVFGAINIAQSILSSDEYAIAPSTEALNRFILKHRRKLEDINCIVPLVEDDLYKMISDKESFGILCNNYGITTPRTSNDNLNFENRYVAKPRKYESGSGHVYKPVLVHNREEHELFNRRYDKNDFYFQEFIEGKSFYLLYYFYKDGRVDKLSQNNLIQQPQGGSIIGAKISNKHKQPISKKFEDLFNSLKFRGLVMVEIIEKDGLQYMIEANPRFWGPSQLFVDAGYNLFYSLLEDYEVGTYIERHCYDEETLYFWEGGFSYLKGRYDGVSYHDYSKDELIDSLIKWKQYDVYNREDTVGIYEHEIK